MSVKNNLFAKGSPCLVLPRKRVHHCWFLRIVAQNAIFGWQHKVHESAFNAAARSAHFLACLP